MSEPAPIYDDGTVRVYAADCRDVLPTLPERSAALVLTDMPYGIGDGAAFVRDEDRIENNDDAGWNAAVPMSEWMPVAGRLTVAGGYVATFHNFKTVEATHAGLREAGLEPWTRFWWTKPNPPANPRKAFQSGVEECVIATVPPGPRRWFGGGATLNYWQGVSPTREAGAHPCAKPEAALRRLIGALSDKGDLIIDPFCGGGSVGRACKDMGRRFIGIEIDPHWAAAAARRMRQEVLVA